MKCGWLSRKTALGPNEEQLNAALVSERGLDCGAQSRHSAG
jgi:hypothetical protein